MARSVEWARAEQLREWDAFVEAHPHGLICQLSAWRNVLEVGFPHIHGRFLLVRSPDDGRITAGLPVYTVRSWLLSNRVVAIPFASHCRPLVETREEARLLLDQVLALPEVGVGARVELRAGSDSPFFDDERLKAVCQHKHHSINLGQGVDAVKRRISKTIRRRIQAAETAGLTVRLGEERADLVSFFQMVAHSRRRLGLPRMPYRFFKALWDCMGPRHLRLLLACQGGKPVAGLLMLWANRVCAFEYSGEGPEARSTGAIQLVFWKGIELACKEGGRIVSFGRTSVSNQGLLEYKRWWGTTEEDLPSLLYPPPKTDTATPPGESLSYRMLRAFCSKAPAPLYWLFSEFFYNHWG